PPFVHKVLELLMTSFPEPLAASPMIVVLLRTVPLVMVNVPRPLLPIFMREKVTVPVALSVPLIIRTSAVVLRLRPTEKAPLPEVCTPLVTVQLLSAPMSSVTVPAWPSKTLVFNIGVLPLNDTVYEESLVNSVPSLPAGDCAGLQLLASLNVPLRFVQIRLVAGALLA